MSLSNDIAERLNRVTHYIESHLDQELSLNELAEIAHFSPFHFQRIFKQELGESPKQYIRRMRLEEAAHSIVLSPSQSMLEIAINVGFRSLESFSRAFKDYYSLSPDHFRKSTEAEKLKMIRERHQHPVLYNTGSEENQIDILNFGQAIPVRVIKLPPKRIVFLQTTLESGEKITSCFRQIRQWAVVRGLAEESARPFGLIKDYPVFTSLDKCRYLACMEVNRQTETSGLINYMEIPSRTWAVFEATGDMSRVVTTINLWSRQWLPQSGYHIVHNPALEIPLTDPLTTDFDKNRFEIHIEIQPA